MQTFLGMRCRWPETFVLLFSLLFLTGCGRTAEPPMTARTESNGSPLVPAAETIPSSTSSTNPDPDKPKAVDDPAAAVAEKPQQTSRNKRDPIYQEVANGPQLVEQALTVARRDGKRVLVEFGGNWCGWCWKLHDVFQEDPTVSPIVQSKYVLVLIDQGKNRDLMQSYGGEDRRYAFPHLVVLDADGKVLTNQETGSLEDGPKHDPAKVAAFLNQWAASP